MKAEDHIRRYRDAIGHFPTGVCVVTAFSENGPTGMTANAITSLSLDPLLMLVCFDRTARTRVAAEASGRVAVNVLAADHVELSSVFASKASEEEKFAGVSWTERAGAPVLDGAVSWFVGALTELRAGGDHEIGIVAVEEFDEREGEPLVYYRGRYSRLELG